MLEVGHFCTHCCVVFAGVTDRYFEVSSAVMCRKRKHRSGAERLLVIINTGRGDFGFELCGFVVWSPPARSSWSWRPRNSWSGPKCAFAWSWPGDARFRSPSVAGESSNQRGWEEGHRKYGNSPRSSVTGCRLGSRWPSLAPARHRRLRPAVRRSAGAAGSRCYVPFSLRRYSTYKITCANLSDLKLRPEAGHLQVT